VSLSQHPPDSPAPSVNTKLLRALVGEGALSNSDADAAALYAKRRSLHFEEALLQAGYFDEASLLRFQAKYYKTNFVSTQKLASAPISDSLLRLVPHKLANRFCVFPVRYDSKAGELMILTVAPDDLEVLKNVQWATRVPKVRALVARPAAILAAIQVHYEDEPQAFGNIKSTGPVGADVVTERDRSRKVTQNYDGGPASAPGAPAPGVGGPGDPALPSMSMPPIQSVGPGPVPSAAPAPPMGGPPMAPAPPLGGAPLGGPSQAPPMGGPPMAPAPPMPPQAAPAMQAPPMGAPPVAPQMPMADPMALPPADATSTGTMDVQPMPLGGPPPAVPFGTQLGQPVGAPPAGVPPAGVPPVHAPAMGGTVAGFGAGMQQPAAPMQYDPMAGMPGAAPAAAPAVPGVGAPDPAQMLRGTQDEPGLGLAVPEARGVAMHDYLETLNVMVALLESDRGDLRGHSVSVARLCRRFCERLGLTPVETDGIVAASYLHDIGKSSAFHLTALNVAQYEQHRTQAMKSYLTPVRIFESVRLPEKVSQTLTHLYERHDGQGFPDHLMGKEIGLGARVLSIAETYADLTGHAGNAFRKKLSAQEAWDVLSKYKGKIFDANLVDVFKLVVLGDDLRAKLLADGRRALIVDADAEETTILELRLIEHGYEVTIARNSNDAENELSAEFDVVISEVDIKPLDGFQLLERVRSEGSQVPFVFLSKASESETVQRGFDLGADEFISKPASPDVVALKINRVLDSQKRKKRTGGVSGSLTEMALPDVVQILYHGRKSGRLTITAQGRNGEILFNEGQIFEAKFGEVLNEDAFYEMLSLVDGDFELDPNFSPTERLIQMNPESLLLEGMRRLDEVQR